MGDTRFRAPYEQIRKSRDKPAHLAALRDDEVVQALAHASREREPFLANVLATEAVNRMRRASAIATHMAEGAFAVDGTLRLTFVNPAMGRMLERPWADLVGMPIFDAWHLLDKDHRPLGEEECPCVVARATRSAVEVDVHVTSATGRTFPASIHVTPILDEGDVVALVGSMRDLTSDREALQRVRSMLDRAPLAAFSLDADGAFVDVNAAGERLVARSRDQLIGQSFLPHLDESEVETALAEFARVLSGESRVHEYNIKRPDGTFLRARITGVPMWEGDRIVGMHGFAEAVVSESEAWFRTLADSAPVMIWMSGPDARCTYFNRGWLGFTGRTFDEEIGDGWMQGVHPDDRERAHRGYLDRFSRREPFELEYRLRRGDGAYAWILDRGLPRYDADGTFLGYVGSCIDIHEHKMLEQRLDERVAERTARLTRALRDVETFTTSASHDLRAPLRGVDALLHAVLEDYRAQIPPGAAAILAQARRENGRAVTLVQDLLAFTRSGHQELDLEDVDAHRMVLDLAGDMRAHHPEWRAAWDIRAVPRVRADAGLLRIAIHNLLANAAKYASRAAQPRVVVHGETVADEWRLHVEDNGVGFDPAQAARLFEPFHRLPNAAGYDGTGLGLATVRRIAERHAGRVSAAGALGRGATFTLALPVHAG